jgi:hypothetical protein
MSELIGLKTPEIDPETGYKNFVWLNGQTAVAKMEIQMPSAGSSYSEAILHMQSVSPGERGKGYLRALQSEVFRHLAEQGVDSVYADVPAAFLARRNFGGFNLSYNWELPETQSGSFKSAKTLLTPRFDGIPLDSRVTSIRISKEDYATYSVGLGIQIDLRNCNETDWDIIIPTSRAINLHMDRSPRLTEEFTMYRHVQTDIFERFL